MDSPDYKLSIDIKIISFLKLFQTLSRIMFWVALFMNHPVVIVLRPQGGQNNLSYGGGVEEEVGNGFERESGRGIVNSPRATYFF